MRGPERYTEVIGLRRSWRA